MLRKKMRVRWAECRRRLELHHIDLGPVGAWGYPSDGTRREHWPLYAAAPWHLADLDLVLIDGGFGLPTSRRQRSMPRRQSSSSMISGHVSTTTPALGILEPYERAARWLSVRCDRPSARRPPRWPTTIATNAPRRSAGSRRRDHQSRRRCQAPRPIPSRPISRVEAAQAGRLRLDDESSLQA
jgi:hypothetical protein